MPNALLQAVELYGYDGALHNYLLTRVKWNPWNTTGKDPLTFELEAIRSIGY